jgi:hypothetical protein
MRLQDFETLALAKAHEVVTYRKISGNQASQFFGIYGVLDALESNVNNATLTNVLPNTPTSVGALCRTVLRTIDNDGFASDPLTVDGAVNRIASARLVDAGIYSEEVAGLFWAMGKDVSKPFINSTKNDFDLAKGTIARKSVTVEKGFCTIVTTADCEKHSPQVYRKVTFADGTFEYVRVAGFRDVELAGTYRIQCPTFPDMYVDDAYGVVS